jgi:hypothetical protein
MKTKMKIFIYSFDSAIKMPVLLYPLLGTILSPKGD